MKSKLIEAFPNSITFSQNCYVADYSNDNNPGKADEGVVISLNPFTDIEYFHIKKLRDSDRVQILGINFEKHPSFIKGIKSCECCFTPLIPKENGWIMFLEMKYCKPEKAISYATEVFRQMKASYDKMQTMELADKKKQQVYFVFSVPKSTVSIPFLSFLTSPGSTIKKEQMEGIHLLGANSILIATPQYLKVPKNKI